MSDPAEFQPTPSEPDTAQGAVQPPIVSSDDLFGAERQILIRHREELYRLQITRTGKLILTK